MVRSGQARRGLCSPQEELAKLRKVTESPEDQYRREQAAALAAALDEFLAEHGTPTQAQPDHAPNRRRRGDRGRNAERAERALEAEVEREKEKARHRPRHHRNGKSQQPLPLETELQGLAAEAEEALYQEEAVRRRHRNSRSRNRSNPHPHPEKPNRTKPGEERKGRSHWHKKGHRKSGGGTPPAEG